MKKVLIATDKPFAKAAVDGIKKIVQDAGYELVMLEKYTNQQQFIDAVANVDALIIRSDLATKEVIDAAKQLKIIVRAGAGYDNIDLKAATDKKIVAMNTPGQNANAVAELVFGMMIYNARKAFSGASGFELKGKKLGIHAFGNVGRNVARIAKGFDMEVIGFDPFLSKEDFAKLGVKQVDSKEELYQICDYVSLHIPANEQTKKSINYELISSMPKNAVLINTARKEVINEDDLIKIMTERKDIAYLSDIEPDKKKEFEEKFQGRILFTAKKMGAQTEEANINAGLAAARQIVAFFENDDQTFKVN